METLSVSEGRVKFKPSEENGSNDFSSRFKVCRCLSEGGTSQLYLAVDTFIDSTYVVLKCIRQAILQSESSREIASRELAIARQLSHPNLVTIYELYRESKLNKNSKGEYLVMEYLSGVSLKDLLSRQRVRYSSAVSVLRPLVDVIEYLHQQGVVHSDIKPSNIMITRDNKVKLIDLANCRRDSHNSKPAVTINNDHFFGYSLDYSSPQVISDQPATTGDDVFSLACVLYELLEGRSPISAGSIISTSSIPAGIPTGVVSIRAASTDTASTDTASMAAATPSMPVTSSKKPALINYWQWLVLKKGMAVDNNRRYQSVRSFYRRFIFARYFPAILLCGVLLLSALGFTGFKWWHSTVSYDTQSVYQEVYQQQDEMDGVINLIRSQLPVERHQWLYRLRPFPDLLQQGALSLLYSDVVDPIVDFVKTSISRPNTIPDFDKLNSIVDDLLTFYPHSKDLDRLKDLLIDEQQVFIENLTFKLSNIVSGGEYHLAKSYEVATIFEKLAKLGVSSKVALLEVGYTEYYGKSRKPQ